MNKEIKEKIKREARLEMCRRDFYFFCKTLQKKFYVTETNSSEHLKILCDTLQDFVFNDKKHDTLVINMGPRHGKSFTMSNFCDFYLGHRPEGHVMVGTYNEKLSTKFAKTVRNTIQEKKSSDGTIVYSDIFPGTKIKYGEAAANLWSLDGENSYDSFLSTSPNGSSTGFASTLTIIDDLVQDAKEAYNPRKLQEHWDWFNNTMISRLEKGGKIIIMATRWHSQDLSGRVIEEFGDRVRVLTMKTCLSEETHEMLCPKLLPWEEYIKKISTMDKRIALANYQQICIDTDSVLYKNLHEYDYNEFIKNPDGKLLEKYCYIDTADTGSDYECAISFTLDWKKHRIYILDVLYTQDPMEITEEELAKRFKNNRINIARFEQNNGGRGHARAVERITQEKYKNFLTQITYFHQSNNKVARIRSNASTACSFLYFPSNWNIIWPEFYRDLSKFDIDTSEHDDCADALTGVIETATNMNFFYALQKEDN